MHPRNIYNNVEATNFRTLADENPELKKFLKIDGSLDFSKPETDYVLAETLLKRDFNLNVKLSRDRLCPRVSNRLEYVLWIQDLLDSTSPTEHWPDDVPVSGIDIGTGASALYALLACKLRSNWHIIGTDIDQEALKLSSEIIDNNRVSDRINIVKASSTLIDLDELHLDRIEFTMCNPPFYSSLEEMHELKKQKTRAPKSTLLAAPGELITPGGEDRFIKNMIDESLLLRERVKWYTSQCGKLSTAESIVEYLREKSISNYAITEFDNSQSIKNNATGYKKGSITKRWGVAWSFLPRKPWGSACRISSPSLRSANPPPCEKNFIISGTNKSDIISKVNDFLESLRFCDWGSVNLDNRAIKRLEQQDEEQDISVLDISAPDNVWSRSFRRKLNQANSKGEMQNLIDSLSHKPSAIQMRLYICPLPRNRYCITLRWVCGMDYSLFESFEGSLCSLFNRM